MTPNGIPESRDRLMNRWGYRYDESRGCYRRPIRLGTQYGVWSCISVVAVMQFDSAQLIRGIKEIESQVIAMFDRVNESIHGGAA